MATDTRATVISYPTNVVVWATLSMDGIQIEERQVQAYVEKEESVVVH
jgi:hypothetical protein